MVAAARYSSKEDASRNSSKSHSLRCCHPSGHTPCGVRTDRDPCGHLERRGLPTPEVPQRAHHGALSQWLCGTESSASRSREKKACRTRVGVLYHTRDTCRRPTALLCWMDSRPTGLASAAEQSRPECPRADPTPVRAPCAGPSARAWISACGGSRHPGLRRLPSARARAPRDPGSPRFGSRGASARGRPPAD